jgi:U3 small nucleolar ribonucleoprotein protein IMP4
MLRRQARLRREYLYRKTVEDQKRTIQEKKDKLKQALEAHQRIPLELRKEAVDLYKDMEWDDEGGEAIPNAEDDEYRWAGVNDPKIMISTSRDPSSRLKQFAKEFRLLFPTAQRMNRGNYGIEEMVSACKANNVTDFILLHEHRGEPNGLVISHLPYGPTAYFTLYNTVMRHEVPGMKTMSEEYPHLIFHNFKSRLGKRVMNILKYLFPVPKEESRRVMTFANQEDFVSFRHHSYRKTENGRDLELNEIGPRFEMRLFLIRLGTLDQGTAADTEWVLKPFLNTAKKRRFLSDDNPW